MMNGNNVVFLTSRNTQILLTKCPQRSCSHVLCVDINLIRLIIHGSVASVHSNQITKDTNDWLLASTGL